MAVELGNLEKILLLYEFTRSDRGPELIICAKCGAGVDHNSLAGSFASERFKSLLLAQERVITKVRFLPRLILCRVRSDHPVWAFRLYEAIELELREILDFAFEFLPPFMLQVGSGWVHEGYTFISDEAHNQNL